MTYRTIKPSSFYLDHLPSSKNFNHITMDTNVFHLKLGDNHRFNHFPTFTFQNTPPINTINLLQTINFWHINIVDLSQVVSYGHEKFFTVTLNQIMSYHLSLFLNFTPLYICLIYGMFFNKAFQNCSFEKLHMKQWVCSNYEYTYFWNFIFNQYIEQKCYQMFIQPLQMLVPFANKNVLNVFLWLLIGVIQFCYDG